VADSDPVAEDEETLNKARAVLSAIATAATLASPTGSPAESPREEPTSA
jgi:anthranilate synthase component 1